MPSASFSEDCCQRGHQLGIPWGPPTSPCRTFKLSGPGVWLPRTTGRQNTALHDHIVVETQVPVILTRIQHSMTWAGGENSEDSAQAPQAASASSVTSPEPPGSDPSSTTSDWHNFGGWGGLEPKDAQPGSEGASLLPATVTWTPLPSEPIRKAADRSGQAA